MRKRLSGFTLIELLVVIGIIAILAAIIFPVFSRAKLQAYKNADIAEMNTLRSALQLYKADQGAYPPQLLGYVTLYASGPNAGNVIPADQIKSYLYPSRVRSADEFQPAQNRFRATEITTAVYPNQDPRAVGTAALMDLNGDGSVVPADDDPAGARQAYGPGDGNICIGGLTEADLGAGCGSGTVAEFYRMSGYDVADVPAAGTGGDARVELRYTLFWTTWGLSTGNALDDPRQLGYSDPPDSTVITWDSYFREYDAATNRATGGRLDIALFVGGAARPYASDMLHQRAWRVMP